MERGKVKGFARDRTLLAAGHFLPPQTEGLPLLYGHKKEVRCGLFAPYLFFE